VSLAQTPMNAKVMRVIDGDTLVCEVDGEQVTVRLSGIDCFEAQRTSKLRKQAARAGISLDEAFERGIQAKLFTTLLLTGRNIELRLNPADEDRDRFGRYVREVWLEGENCAIKLKTENYNALP
jgi:micrococcal nuclease